MQIFYEREGKCYMTKKLIKWYTLNAKLTKFTDYRSSPVKYTAREFFIQRLKCTDAHTLLLVT